MEFVKEFVIRNQPKKIVDTDLYIETNGIYKKNKQKLQKSGLNFVNTEIQK